MNKIKSIILTIILTASFSFADSAETSNDFTVKDGFLATGDVLVVRPLAAAGSVGAFGIFAVLAPFAAMADAVPETFNTIVENPGQFAFDRDLGDFKK
jgi:hypothetical protein